LLLHDWCYEIVWALLGKEALRSLAFWQFEIVRVLAWIAIPVLTPHQGQQAQGQHEASHASSPSRPGAESAPRFSLSACPAEQSDAM